jgi:hypothetical protein
MKVVLRRPASRHSAFGVGAAIVLAATLLGALAVWSNVLGVGDELEGVARRIELIVDPPPDRPIAAAVHVTPRPSLEPTPSPSPTPFVLPDPSIETSTPEPTPTPTPAPVRAKVDVDLLADPAAHFITEIDHEWCAVAGTQMVLEIHGKAKLTRSFQETLASRIGEWESRRDSLNGGWGPAAIAAALDAYGVPGYEVRTYDTRADALRDAAVAISELHAPVLLMTWRGAHTWVMTGYRATADPTIFDDATVTGAYILDPWYPRVSSIWGASDPPGTFQNAAEMRRNYLPWKRPEGHYPDRDGLFVAVVPTIALQP